MPEAIQPDATIPSRPYRAARPALSRQPSPPRLLPSPSIRISMAGRTAVSLK